MAHGANSASLSGGEKPPKHWEKWIGAAYFRMMGLTQEDAGKAVGRSKRSIAEWETDKTRWALAREVARQRWLGVLTDAARVSLLRTIQEGNGELSLKILERIDEELAPPAQRTNMQIEGGGLASLLALARENPHADA